MVLLAIDLTRVWSLSQYIAIHFQGLSDQFQGMGLHGNQGMPRAAVRPAPNFSAEKDAEVIRKAMKGAGKLGQKCVCAHVHPCIGACMHVGTMAGYICTCPSSPLSHCIEFLLLNIIIM